MSYTKWDLVINSKSKKISYTFKDVWDYKDLLIMFVRRDFIAFYTQTILGPIWFFIQPLFTSILYLFVFKNIAGLSTGGLPPSVFYISGIALWTYFGETLSKTSSVLRDHASIFGKVYFPRILVPLSICLSNFFKLLIQLLLLLLLSIFYSVNDSTILSINIFFIPLLIALLAIQAIGLGLILSALSTKYKDLVLALGFAMQVMMYTAPIVYPISSLEGYPKLFVHLNPLSSTIESFRFCFFGKGEFSPFWILYSVVLSIVILLVGLKLFGKAEKNFIDTV